MCLSQPPVKVQHAREAQDFGVSSSLPCDTSGSSARGLPPQYYVLHCAREHVPESLQGSCGDTAKTHSFNQKQHPKNVISAQFLPAQCGNLVPVRRMETGAGKPVSKHGCTGAFPAQFPSWLPAARPTSGSEGCGGKDSGPGEPCVSSAGSSVQLKSTTGWLGGRASAWTKCKLMRGGRGVLCHSAA